MVIGVCTIELHLPGCGSLKAKRSVIKSLMARLQREFNVAVAEVDFQDVWQSSAIAVVTVSAAAVPAEQTIDLVLRWIENNRPDVDVVGEERELIK